jgi:predicted ATPase
MGRRAGRTKWEMSRQVYICHASADARTAEQICARLESDGVPCWIAPRDPTAGIPYAQQLVGAIESARILLLVLSAHANESRAVLSEVELASNRGKIVLPVRIDDVAPSPGLEFYIRAIHWFDATRPAELAWAELVREVRELVGGGVEAEPAVQAPRMAQHNLPLALTSFVGRDAEVAQIEKLLQSSRLLTLSGPGGIGKTSLAVAVVRRNLDAYRDGAWFVDLAQVHDATSFLQAFAATFGLEGSPSGETIDVVISHLKNKRLLLVIDNCEQVVAEAARIVEAILQTCPYVIVVATTREPLAVRGEEVFRVPSLAVPDERSSRTLTAAAALEYGAIELFVDRAHAANRSFALMDEIAPAVAAICRRLDGIALAIELAAARVNVLSVKGVASSLDERFALLTGGTRTALPRQKTLRAMIDWSYDLLSEKERVLFRRLAVFAGSFTLREAAAVVKLEPAEILDLLASLIDKSLLQADFIVEPTRYALLESMRAYANEKLGEHGELASLNRAHAEAFAAAAERLERAFDTIPDAEWMRLAEPQLDNSRAALRWAFGPDGDVPLGQRLVAALRPTWFAMAPSEGQRWIAVALASLDGATPTAIAAKLALCEAHLAMVSQQYSAALPQAERASRLFSELSDRQGEALANMFAGAALGMQGEIVEGTSLLKTSLQEFRASRSRRNIAGALNYLGICQLISDNVAASRPFFYEALDLYKSIGAARPAAHVASYLAEAAFQDGDPADAARLVREALSAERILNDPDDAAFVLCNLAAYLVALDSWNDARDSAQEALQLALDREIPAATVWALHHLVAIAALRAGDDEAQDRRRAARLAGFVDGRIAELNLPRNFTEQAERERTSEAIGNALGTEAAALEEEGRGWSESRAVEEARAI